MITANELKTRGIKAIEENLNEVGITVHGKVKYIAMTEEQYDQMRASELDVAYDQVMNDIDQGPYTVSIKNHIAAIRTKAKKMPEYISNQYNIKAIKFLVSHPELIDKYEKSL